MTAGAAAEAVEIWKHTTNGQRSTKLEWFCVLLVVESHGAWGTEIQKCSVRTSCLMTGCSHVKQQVKDDFRSVQPTEPRSIAREIISRSFNFIDFVA